MSKPLTLASNKRAKPKPRDLGLNARTTHIRRQAGSLDAVVGRPEWEICLKHPMWHGWKSLVRMYGCTREHAEAEAKRAIHYYDGSTAWKVKPSNDKALRPRTPGLPLPPVTGSADMLSSVHIRIYSRCPACHNDTLTINRGRLLCTWYQCSDPTLIDRLGEYREATNCAVCGQRKHTPLRNDEMGGYVCLTCIDRELERLQAANPQNAAMSDPRRA